MGPAARQRRNQSLSNPLSKHKPKANYNVTRVRVCIIALLSLISVAAVYLWKSAMMAGEEQVNTGESDRTGAIQRAEVAPSKDGAIGKKTAEQRHSAGNLRAAAVAEMTLEEKSGELVEGGTITLQLDLGTIRIVLRPDLSPESIKYVRSIVANGCDNCNFYRAQKPGILQGVISSTSVSENKVLGKCPLEYQKAIPKDCPKWDPHCGCHGPIMTRGMVGWAAGRGGPDFFIDTYRSSADWWENQHTVWGEVQDDESFAVIEKIYKLPAEQKGAMMMIVKKINFTPVFML